MKTIFTIDFDIIMAPSIMLYNEYIPRQSLNELKDKCGLYNWCKADMVHYARLTRLLLHLIENLPQNKIHFIHNHDRVEKFIKEPCNLINIDHHHDLSYNKEIEQETLDKIGCANWVRWLYEHELINTYLWIKNDTSVFPEKNFEYVRYMDLKQINNLEDFIDKNKVDEIIICFSEPWIPQEYFELFYLWMDLCNK